MRKKVSVIGAGNVGATCAQYIAELEIADVVLLDIAEGIPQGKSLDLMEAGPVRNIDVSITGSDSYDQIEGSDIVVVTAGLARKPGMSREDLLLKNAEIISHVSREIAEKAPDSIVIIVTNPLDVMTSLAWKRTGFAPERVIGMAGVLDSSRMKYFISKELGVSVRDIQALVMGGHGDSMVPIPHCCTVSGIPLAELLDEERISYIVEKTRNAGAEIVSYLKTGSAYYSPGASVCVMVESILKDLKRILPASAYLNGEYGIKELFVGVPVILGQKGVEKIVEIDLSETQKSDLHSSADIIKSNVDKISNT